MIEIVDNSVSTDGIETESTDVKETGNKVTTVVKNEQQKEAPTFIGCSEIENRGVLENLVKQPNILKDDYGIVHFDSPDKRGIDVGLLYQKKYFKPTSFVNIPLIIYRGNKTGSSKIPVCIPIIHNG